MMEGEGVGTIDNRLTAVAILTPNRLIVFNGLHEKTMAL
jgi:hypothetical protein